MKIINSQTNQCCVVNHQVANVANHTNQTIAILANVVVCINLVVIGVLVVVTVCFGSGSQNVGLIFFIVFSRAHVCVRVIGKPLKLSPCGFLSHLATACPIIAQALHTNGGASIGGVTVAGVLSMAIADCVRACKRICSASCSDIVWSLLKARPVQANPRKYRSC